MNKQILAITIVIAVINFLAANAMALQTSSVEAAADFTGATWADKINAAIASLPASGGTVDARPLCLKETLPAAGTDVVLGSDTRHVHLELGSCSYPLGAHSILYFPETEVSGEGSATRITFTGPYSGFRYGGSLQSTGVYRVYLHDFSIEGNGSAGSIGIDMTYALESTLARLNIGRVDNGWKFGGTGTCSCYNQIIGVFASGTRRGGWLDKTANQNQIFGGIAWGAIGLDIDGAASNQVYSLDFEGKRMTHAIVFERQVYAPNGNIIVNPYLEATGPILLTSGAVENAIIGAGGLFERGSIIDNSGNTTNYFHQVGGGGGTHGIWPYYQAVQNGIVFGGDPFNNSFAELSSPGPYGASQLRWTTTGPSNQYGVFGHAPLELGEAIVRSGAQVTGLVTTAQLPRPGSPIVTSKGITGRTGYRYYVACHDRNGGFTRPSLAGSTSTGNTTLTGANYNEITWKPIDGCWSWDILKGNTMTALVTNQRVPLSHGEVLYTFKDVGQATQPYRPAVRNTTGDLRVSGMTISVGIRWPLPDDVADGASFYCPNCDPSTTPPSDCTSHGARTGSWVHGLDNRWICVP